MTEPAVKLRQTQVAKFDVALPMGTRIGSIEERMYDAETGKHVDIAAGFVVMATLRSRETNVVVTRELQGDTRSLQGAIALVANFVADHGDGSFEFNCERDIRDSRKADAQ